MSNGSDDFFSITSNHWIVNRIIPSVYTVVFLVALPLNILAIVMFLVKSKVRKPAVVYMLNLATVDLLLISVLPYYIVYRFSGTNWFFGEGMCRFAVCAYYCNMYCSILLMTSISVDRFLAIVYSVRSLPWRTVHRAWVVCGVIWVISLASTVPLLIREQTMSSLYKTTCYEVQDIEDYIHFYFFYFTSVTSLFFFLPLVTTTFCYIGTIRSLSRSRGAHRRSRPIRLTMAVLCVFVLCFGPTNVLFLIHFVQLANFSDTSLYITNIVCMCISHINCCLDPLIYYFASSQYQRYVYSLMRWKKPNGPSGGQK